MSSSKSNIRITTPHAAVLIWNYDDRGGYDGLTESNYNKASSVIISTLSCISITTSKSKGDPQGTFGFQLAPTKNWVSVITPGSWCAILMSDEKITKEDIDNANYKNLKMIGRIESVRVSTQVDSSGTRSTVYYVSGVDWGSVFNSVLYIDNYISEKNETANLGNSAAIAIQDMLFGVSNTPKSFSIKENLTKLMGIIGQDHLGVRIVSSQANRLGKAVYELQIPDNLRKFMRADTVSLAAIIKNNIKVGALVGEDKYSEEDPCGAIGFIDPYSFQGTHTLWEILAENSNPAMNEMVAELRWERGTPKFTLYNRIKPFSFIKKDNNKIRSMFQKIKTHEIDKLSVISVNAGTNWRDKYNFVEIKPQFQEMKVFENDYKRKTQKYDKNQKSFYREGFRPLIVNTKQFPSNGSSSKSDFFGTVNFDRLGEWSDMLKEWYFDTHNLLNGSIQFTGQDFYIGTGDNIKFSADLINPNSNFKKSTLNKNNTYVLAHVEQVSHEFKVESNGARSYITNIQFVRGIFVEGDGTPLDSIKKLSSNLISKLKTGSTEGSLDTKLTLTSEEQLNSKNTFSTATESDTDPKARNKK
jgi:hypothetical protein